MSNSIVHDEDVEMMDELQEKRREAEAAGDTVAASKLGRAIRELDSASFGGDSV